ncbi:hypothetical protein ATEIFO6365_0010018500 [Aspergillus terreus]|uniref:Uncharacterized protein n=1 Tax=Aspergillus terreus TaxID=33178 RepID=A0A5M3Z9C8_ASPTE|nr:hypothetical protein ATETN484_0012016400 [Aspergillus terreus]GFF19412.1 hypothetical protein ATEIFO6365_0010018500 [Aspergillus terreus]
MDIQTSLQPKTLLRLSYPALASHLQDLVKQSPGIEHVHLLDRLISQLIEAESLPATIYAVWLPIALRYSPALLSVALSNTASYGIRQAGIRSLSRAFHSKSWRSTWNALGGAEGMMRTLCESSISQVDDILKALTKCRYMSDRAEIARPMDELFLLVENHTLRPLSLYSDRLLPLCSSEMVAHTLATLNETQEPTLLTRWLVPFHATLLRQIVVGSVVVPPHVRRCVVRNAARGLVRSSESYTPFHCHGGPADLQDPRVTFCLDFFHVLGTDRDLERVRGEVSLYVKTFLQLRDVRLDHILLVVEAALPLAMKFFVPPRPKSRLPPAARQKKQNQAPAQKSILTVPLARELLVYWSLAVCGETSTTAESVVKTRISKKNAPRPNAEHRPALERLIVQILRDYPDEQLDVQNIPREDFSKSVECLCETVAPEARLSLLQLLCQHTKYLSYDISSPIPSERERSLPPAWPPSVLRLLPAADAEHLFRRTLKVYSCAEFLPDIDVATTHGFDLVYQHMLKAKWEGESGVKEFAITRKCLDEIMKRAQEETDEPRRLRWVKGALWVAQESSSIEIFHAALRWSGRFIRNPPLFAGVMLGAILQGQTIDLLSCVESPTARQPTSLSELSTAVQAANTVLDTLLDLVLQSIKEPGISPKVLENIPSLIGSIVHKRMLGCTKSKYKQLGSAAQLADTLLAPLIPVIIRYETVGIAEGQEKIKWPPMDGLLGGMPCLANPSDEVLGFMDQLAQRRDELAQLHRQKIDPDVLSLDPGWPRGLAVQFLFPTLEWARVLISRPQAAPFIARRTEEVLFAPRDVLLRDAPMGRAPIGVFVDDLPPIVEAYVGRGRTEEMQSRVVRIWQHYEEELCDHPEHLAMFRIWFSRANRIRSPRIRKMMHKINPSPVPTATYVHDSLMPDEVVEWDPRPGEVYEYNTPVTVLRCREFGERLTFERLIYGNEATRDDIRCWPFEYYSVYSSPHTFSLETKETIALSALLILETFTKQRILLASFPERVPRYPAMYLDGQFVSKMHVDSAHILRRVPWVLKSFSRTVSPTLLKDTCNAMIDSVVERDANDTMYAPLLRCAVQLIRILSHSDKPSHAAELVLRIVEELPHESSYYEELKPLRLGRRLHPEQAGTLFREIGALVKDRLLTVRTDDDQATNAVAIISTAKKLAQFLGDADFLSVDTAVGILESLFTSTPNTDVRVQTLLSIFTLLGRDIAPDSVYALLKQAAHLASGPSETLQVSEEEWRAAETGHGPLPRVPSTRQRPIFQRLVYDAHDYIPDKQMESYLQTIVLPLLDESATQHTRWMKAFLARLHLPEDIDITDFPFGPFDPHASHRVLLTWKKYLPASYLQHTRAAAFAHLHYKTLDAVSAALSERDAEFRNTSESEHWLDCLELYRHPPSFEYLDLLFRWGEQLRVSNGLTLDAIAEEYVLRAGILVRNPITYSFIEKRFVVQPALVTELLVALSQRWQNEFAGEGKETQRLLAGEMLRKIVDDIESLRTPEWLSSPLRTPPTLPSAMRLQTLLLPFPRGRSGDEDSISAFVRELLQLVRRCAEDRLIQLEFGWVQRAANRVGAEHRRDCALLVGDVDDAGLYECLRVQLAYEWLCEISEGDVRLDKELIRMFGKWKMSPVEVIRRMGWIMDGGMKDSEGDALGDCFQDS